MRQVEAAACVHFRCVYLLPSSLLQPRSAPMECSGIKYTENMQAKMRKAALLGLEPAPRTVPVLLTETTRKKKTEGKCNSQVQVEQSPCSKPRIFGFVAAKT